MNATVKGWESACGIQAHLEVVERLLEAEVKARATRMRKMLKRVERRKKSADRGQDAEQTADGNDAERGAEEDSGSEDSEEGDELESEEEGSETEAEDDDDDDDE